MRLAERMLPEAARPIRRRGAGVFWVAVAGAVVATAGLLAVDGVVSAVVVAVLSCALLAGWRTSERRRAALEESERRQRVILDSLEDGVLLFDRDGSLVMANPRALRLLAGVLPEPDLPLPEWTALHADGTEIPPRELPMWVARRGQAVIDAEVGVRRPDAPVLWMRGSAIPLADDPDDPGPYPVVMSFTDITARLGAREALERSNAELRQFAYVASHDLSEPLRMVTSYLQLLRRRYGDGRLGVDADEFIGHAVDGAVRMRALIEDLLSYSRAGRASEPREIESEALVEAVLADLGASLEDAQAQVHLGELPVLHADRLQLRQVFQNLIANALKFRRGPGVRVWVGAERVPDGWCVSVADDGIGIPPEHRDRVFEMFQRLHRRDDFEGTGIGLAICRKIVESHGGRIWVDERDGGGTVFRFTLPAAAAVDETPTEHAAGAR
jgi:signal transduction histidine kinase